MYYTFFHSLSSLFKNIFSENCFGVYMSSIFQEKHTQKKLREQQFNLLFNLQSKYYHDSFFFFHKFCFFLDTFFNNVDLLHYRNSSNFSLCLLMHITFNLFLGRFLIFAFHFVSSLVTCSNVIFSQIYTASIYH